MSNSLIEVNNLKKTFGGLTAVDIKKLGFNKAELMATISGILLYQNRGYEVDKEIEYESRAGNKVRMYRMFKNL